MGVAVPVLSANRLGTHVIGEGFQLASIANAAGGNSSYKVATAGLRGGPR